MAGPDGGRRARTAARPERRRLVVIGNGMTGTRAVEEILSRGGPDQFRITMFGDEPHGNYDRTRLGHLLSGEQGEADLLLNPPGWYRANGITLHAGVRAHRIDKFTRDVYSDDGRVTPYDVLIIATGSRPHVPPLGGLYTAGGAMKRGVFGFRTIGDVHRAVQYARQIPPVCRAVVLGGGPGGLAAAYGLERCGLDVVAAPSAGGSAIVLGGDNVSGIRVRNRGDIACDMVVAAGVRPNVELAVLSGLPVERALVVDDFLRVQDEDDIYAVGECVQHRGEVYGLVEPLWEQAAVLAGHVTGTSLRTAFRGSRSVAV